MAPSHPAITAAAEKEPDSKVICSATGHDVRLTCDARRLPSLPSENPRRYSR